MAFVALEVSVQLISSLKQPMEILQRWDRHLTGQVRKAANSVSLNLGEGRRRGGRDRLQHFRIAAGSASEVHTALRVALAWGYFEAEAVAESLRHLDRLQGLLWGLTHGRAG
jgi:four helix bundle protein